MTVCQHLDYLVTCVDDSSSGGAVQIGALDDVVLGVRPVQLVCGVVQGQPVGPEEGGVGYHRPPTPIHVAPLYLRHLTPVRPKYHPYYRKTLYNTCGTINHQLGFLKKSFIYEIPSELE